MIETVYPIGVAMHILILVGGLGALAICCGGFMIICDRVKKEKKE